MKTTLKNVKVTARYAHKTNGKLNGKVTYAVRSSDETTIYYTTLIDGVASGCSCPSHKKCYHKTQLEQKEAARPFAAKVLPVWTETLVKTGKLATPTVAKADESTTIQPIQIADVGKRGNLNTSRAFSLMR